MGDHFIQQYTVDQIPFYVNMRSGETSWTLPPHAPADAVRYITHLTDQGVPYYEDVQAGTTSWTLPLEKLSTSARRNSMAINKMDRRETDAFMAEEAKSRTMKQQQQSLQHHHLPTGQDSHHITSIVEEDEDDSLSDASGGVQAVTRSPFSNPAQQVTEKSSGQVSMRQDQDAQDELHDQENKDQNNIIENTPKQSKDHGGLGAFSDDESESATTATTESGGGMDLKPDPRSLRAMKFKEAQANDSSTRKSPANTPKAMPANGTAGRSNIIVQKANVRSVFEKYQERDVVDSKGEEYVTHQGLQELCVDHGTYLTLEEILTAMRDIDNNSDGVFQYEEFMVWWRVNPFSQMKKNDPETKKKLEAAAAFKMFDPHLHGQMTRQEFAKLHREMSRLKLTALSLDDCIDHLDSSLSGIIHFNDYIALVMNPPQPRTGNQSLQRTDEQKATPKRTSSLNKFFGALMSGGKKQASDETEEPMVEAKDHVDYAKYFRLIDFGGNIVDVREQMRQAGLDDAIIHSPNKMIPAKSSLHKEVAPSVKRFNSFGTVEEVEAASSEFDDNESDGMSHGSSLISNKSEKQQLADEHAFTSHFRKKTAVLADTSETESKEPNPFEDDESDGMSNVSSLLSGPSMKSDVRTTASRSTKNSTSHVSSKSNQHVSSNSSRHQTLPNATEQNADNVSADDARPESKRQSSEGSIFDSVYSQQKRTPRESLPEGAIEIYIQKPLGLTLGENEPDEPLGVHVSKVVSGGNAEKSGKVEQGMILLRACGEDVTEKDFDEVMDILRDAPKGEDLCLVFRAPEREHLAQNEEDDADVVETATHQEHLANSDNEDDDSGDDDDDGVENAAEQMESCSGDDESAEEDGEVESFENSDEDSMEEQKSIAYGIWSRQRTLDVPPDDHSKDQEPSISKEAKMDETDANSSDHSETESDVEGNINPLARAGMFAANVVDNDSDEGKSTSSSESANRTNERESRDDALEKAASESIPPANSSVTSNDITADNTTASSTTITTSSPLSFRSRRLAAQLSAREKKLSPGTASSVPKQSTTSDNPLENSAIINRARAPPRRSPSGQLRTSSTPTTELQTAPKEDGSTHLPQRKKSLSIDPKKHRYNRMLGGSDHIVEDEGESHKVSSLHDDDEASSSSSHLRPSADTANASATSQFGGNAFRMGTVKSSTGRSLSGLSLGGSGSTAPPRIGQPTEDPIAETSDKSNRNDDGSAAEDNETSSPLPRGGILTKKLRRLRSRRLGGDQEAREEDNEQLKGEEEGKEGEKDQDKQVDGENKKRHSRSGKILNKQLNLLWKREGKGVMQRLKEEAQPARAIKAEERVKPEEFRRRRQSFSQISPADLPDFDFDSGGNEKEEEAAERSSLPIQEEKSVSSRSTAVSSFSRPSTQKPVSAFDMDPSLQLARSSPAGGMSKDKDTASTDAASSVTDNDASYHSKSKSSRGSKSSKGSKRTTEYTLSVSKTNIATEKRHSTHDKSSQSDLSNMFDEKHMNAYQLLLGEKQEINEMHDKLQEEIRINHEQLRQQEEESRARVDAYEQESMARIAEEESLLRDRMEQVEDIILSEKQEIDRQWEELRAAEQEAYAVHAQKTQELLEIMHLLSAHHERVHSDKKKIARQRLHLDMALQDINRFTKFSPDMSGKIGTVKYTNPRTPTIGPPNSIVKGFNSSSSRLMPSPGRSPSHHGHSRGAKSPMQRQLQHDHSLQTFSSGRSLNGTSPRGPRS